MKLIKFAAVLSVAVLFFCCGFVHDEKLVGPYRLNAVDTLSQMSVVYDLGNGTSIGRIPETVFSVGWDSRYIVAKQHPNNNRAVTNFYYLEIAKDSSYADPNASVIGPLSAQEFAARQTQLKLPAFSRTINSLE